MKTRWIFAIFLVMVLSGCSTVPMNPVDVNGGALAVIIEPDRKISLQEARAALGVVDRVAVGNGYARDTEAEQQALASARYNGVDIVAVRWYAAGAGREARIFPRYSESGLLQVEIDADDTSHAAPQQKKLRDELVAGLTKLLGPLQVKETRHEYFDFN